MGYQLGIDLGTTYTAAAVCRSSGRGWAEPEVISLGSRSATVASVLFLAADGAVLVGEAAERRALTDPDRVVREFKRRIGDPTPIVVAGRNWAPEELSARLVRWVLDRVAEREGGPADRIAVTHPASWGSHKKDLLTRALAAQGLSVTFLAEPQAAALHYASTERVVAGSTIAVYDLGGGTFDAAVVRKGDAGSAGSGPAGFGLLGRPQGLERLGGVDFDEVVFEHVRAGLPEAFDNLDDTDPAVLSAVSRIRRDCTEAKEALSSDTEVSIPVLLPNSRGSVRLHRSEFEQLIRPQVEQTVDALRQAVTSAGLAPEKLTAVLLVGGSSRIPLVGQLVSEMLGRPVTVDVDPKNAISMGAVLSLQPAPSATGAMPPRVPAPRAGGSARFPMAAAAGAPPLGAGAPPQGPYGPPPPGRGGPGPYGGGASSSLPPHRPAPPRPPVAPPPRPAVAAYQPEYDVEPDYYEPRYDYAPERRGRAPSWLVTVGAIGAAIAVVAAVFLWPRPDTRTSANTPLPAPTQEATQPAPTTTTERPTTAPEEPPLTRPVPEPPPPRPPVTTEPPPVTTTGPPVTTTTPPPDTTEPTDSSDPTPSSAPSSSADTQPVETEPAEVRPGAPQGT